MDPDISIEFKLTGSGWADVTCRFGLNSFVMDGVSDTTDALGDLVRLALVLATGAWTARVNFDREPCEWRLVAGSVFDEQQWREGFWVRIFESPDIYRKLSDEKCDLAFEVSCDERKFVEALLEGAKQF